MALRGAAGLSDSPAGKNGSSLQAVHGERLPGISLPRPMSLAFLPRPSRSFLALLLLGGLLAGAPRVPAAQLELPVTDSRSLRSEAYRVEADGQPVFTAKFHDISYASFAFAGKVTVTVHAPAAIKDFNVSPHAAKIAARADGSALSFELDRPRQLVVTINGGERLFLFADPLDPSAPKLGAPGVVSVLDYDIDPTGRSLATAELQRAIDETAAKHGTLYFPPGVYVTGTLALKSNLTVYLANGARLLGSADPQDYPADPGTDESYTRYDNDLWARTGRTEVAYRRLLLIDGAKNVRLTGRGTLDGQGGLLRPKRSIHFIFVRRSSDVVIENLLLLDSPLYNAHVLDSDRVTFRNVKIVSDPQVTNTDGVDPDSSRDVLVEDCFFYTTDDCVSPKATAYGGLHADLERVTVRRCVFISGTSGTKVGNETSGGGFRDITFEDIDLLNANRAITVSTLDNHFYENIRFINFRIESIFPDGRQYPIEVQVRPRKPGMKAARIHNVLFKNVTVEQEHAKPSRLTGYSAESDIRGVHFENYVIAGRVRLNAADAKVEIGPYVSDVTFTGP
jgi:hypothetical protein